MGGVLDQALAGVDDGIWITGLHDAIDTDFVGIPVMPAELEVHLEPITDRRARELAKKAFEAWRDAAENLDSVVRTGAKCQDSEIEYGGEVSVYDYYPSHDEDGRSLANASGEIPQHFPNGRDLTEPNYFAYAYDKALSQIKVAVAKRSCVGCPVSAGCLSMSLYPETEKGKVIQEVGVWGGLDLDDRLRVLPYLDKLVDAYLEKQERDAEAAEKKAAKTKVA